ncbi:DUF3152 domain-containing protein [Candidatus Saccharibacteria bacterium]|nr:DUF3152 domain-containing protein [Candidatus Saccharibacteria bacterium]
MTKGRRWIGRALAGVAILVSIVVAISGVRVGASTLGLDKDALVAQLTAERIEIPFPESFERWPEPVTSSYSGGTNTASTADAQGHMVDGVKVIYYKTMVWGSAEASFSDFRVKVAETLNDPRGWVRAGLKFAEVDSGQDVNIILSDPANLGATGGCSSELSCTTWANQVIINDVRWREGTEESRAGGMSTRDYQHMVVNHEMGHWLGHYTHIDGCTEENGFAGGPAPIMLQQSTGLRGCTSFNAWPLDTELWTLR